MARLGVPFKIVDGEVSPFRLEVARRFAAINTAAGLPAGAQAIGPVKPGTDPHPRRLTPLGVVRRQPGVTLLGRIQRRDLAGQVVIPGPRCELVEAHRHTHPKGVHTAGAVRLTRATSGGAWGVSNMMLARIEGVLPIVVAEPDWLAGVRVLSTARFS